ncbi:MAG: hypothetical protein ACFFDR_06815, partial [Candidatus Thorarchaeota archaeon]
RGKLMAEGSPRSLKQAHVGNYIIEVELEGLTEGQGESWISEQVGLQVDKVTEYKEMHSRTARIWSVEGYKDLPLVIRVLSERGIVVKQASMRAPSLGDVFLTITGSKLRD